MRLSNKITKLSMSAIVLLCLLASSFVAQAQSYTVTLVKPTNGIIFNSSKAATDIVTVLVTVSGIKTKYWKLDTIATGDLGSKFTFKSALHPVSDTSVNISINLTKLPIDDYWLDFTLTSMDTP